MDPYPSDECLDIYYNDYLSKRRLSNQKKMNLRDKQYVLIVNSSQINCPQEKY